jgi:hypothetical protein
LQGLESLERGAVSALGLPYMGKISSISQDSPISISLSGLKEVKELGSNLNY